MSRHSQLDMIAYEISHPITPDEFIDVLRRSTLGERRPIDDPAAVQSMVDNAGLMITAWDGDLLVGVARSVTDFAYCCYLSDLAVDAAYQRQGIGVALIALTQAQLGPRCNLILLAAPAAADYYGHVGFERHPRCWILPRNKRPVT